MNASCRVNLTDGPPPCARDHRAVVLSCSHLARRWAVLERHSAWLFVLTQVNYRSVLMSVQRHISGGRCSG